MISLAKNESTACVILSGGISSRMGKAKALLSYSGYQNFLQRIISTYHDAGINNIVVVKNADINTSLLGIDRLRVRIVNNNIPVLGRLYSLQLGLDSTNDANYCFIQNIDNPSVSVSIIEQLHAARSKADYISPEYKDKGGHPIIISRPVIDRILMSNDYTHTLRDILKSHSRHTVITENEACLENINLPSDYEMAINNKNNISRS